MQTYAMELREPFQLLIQLTLHLVKHLDERLLCFFQCRVDESLDEVLPVTSRNL